MSFFKRLPFGGWKKEKARRALEGARVEEQVPQRSEPAAEGVEEKLRREVEELVKELEDIIVKIENQVVAGKTLDEIREQDTDPRVVTFRGMINDCKEGNFELALEYLRDKEMEAQRKLREAERDIDNLEAEKQRKQADFKSADEELRRATSEARDKFLFLHSQEKKVLSAKAKETEWQFGAMDKRIIEALEKKNGLKYQLEELQKRIRIIETGGKEGTK